MFGSSDTALVRIGDIVSDSPDPSHLIFSGKAVQLPLRHQRVRTPAATSVRTSRKYNDHQCETKRIFFSAFGRELFVEKLLDNNLCQDYAIYNIKGK